MSISTQTARDLAAALGKQGAANELLTILNAIVASAYNIVTGRTLVVTDADALTVGGVKVPQQQTLVEFTVPILAGKTVYNLFVARDAWQVTTVDYVPDVAEGSTLTATAVKATSTTAPASATTPLHTAAAINLNGTAHTVQPITLSSTTADLQLAVGDRIGFVLSGAMTTGSGRLIVRGKRI